MSSSSIFNLLSALGLCVILSFCATKQETKVAVAETEKVTAAKIDVGVQLYTVRDAMGVDVRGTLGKISAIGYTQLELAGYDNGKFYGLEPAAFKAITDSLSLAIVSSHISVLELNERPELAIASCKAAGIKFMVLPWLTPEQRSITQFGLHIALLNKVGPMVKAAGMKLTYHNHDFEFDNIDGQVPMEMILKGTDPATVNIELDLYWVSKAGLDPIEFMKQYPGRFLLWHVKDMDATPEQAFTEVGNGVINFKEIFTQAESAGMEYFFVEQDQSDDPFKSLETSYGNVINLLQ